MKMLSRLVNPTFRSYLLLHCKTSVSKRWRCTTSSDPKNESAVFVVAGWDDYRIIGKRGTIEPYVPPWSTNVSLKNILMTNPVSNSCDGMMLVPLNNSIFLFNPETKYFQKVLQFDCYNQSENSYRTCLGLCYDTSINDYKALVYIKHDDGGFVARASLKGKQWNKVDFPFQFVDVQQGPVLNGRLHWLAQLPEAFIEDNVIVCFNPISNAFEILPSPPTETGSEDIIMGLAVMDGYLWMTRWRIVDGWYKTGEVEVFKMKEYGVPESWTLMFVLSNVLRSQASRGVTPLLTMENGKVLFSKSHAEQTNYGELLVYNPGTNFCQTHCTTPSWNPQSVPLVKNSSSPVGYNWDPSEHRHFGHFD